MVQDLFKCKPAIMRAFQAAKGIHTVIGCADIFLGQGRRVFNTRRCLSDAVREEVAEATIT